MSSSATCTTVAGVFATRAAAEQAIAELRSAGYTDDQIGLVAKDPNSGKAVKEDGAGHRESNASDGAALGIAAGAVAGAGVGAGIIFGLIPVIGPVLALGTIGTVLVNAAGGAAIAGLAGLLIGLGVPEEDAKYYEGQVGLGRYLVTVECGTGNDARDVLTRHGGYNRMTAPGM